MTTNLEALAEDPQAFDTELARLHGEIEKANRDVESIMDRIHRAAGDRKNRLVRGHYLWHRTATEVLEVASEELLNERKSVLDRVSRIGVEIRAMDRAYTGWTRFFPSVTKSQPHIHRSLTCRTLHPTTVMLWAPQFSGKTDEQAVEELDEALCSVCFPSAPVALHEYVSRRSQAERDERQAAKDARDAAKAAKQLDPQGEAFRTTDGDRIETVAECLRIIRKAVEAEVELEWTRSPAGQQVWTDPESYARVLRNREDALANLVEDAGQAASVLMLREQRHEGHGATMEAIAKIRTSKERSARKEWGL